MNGCGPEAVKVLLGMRESGTKLGELPDDLLAKILLSRVFRVKSLCKLKCVSKQWRNVLSDPYFHYLHYHMSKKTPMLSNFLDTQWLSEYKPGHDYKQILSSIDLDDDSDQLIQHFTLTLDDDGDQFGFTSLGSANGLICLAKMHTLYLCNPSLQQIIELPQPTVSILSMYLGFAFDATRNEYILLHLIFSDDEYIIGCEILTFSGPTRTSSSSLMSSLSRAYWRNIGERCPYVVHEFHFLSTPLGTFADGTFYWALNDSNDLQHIGRVFSFDLDKEKFRVFPFPPNRHFTDVNLRFSSLPCLVQLKGNLCLVDPSVGDYYAPTPSMVVWKLVIKEDLSSSSWIKEYTIQLPSFSHKHDYVALGDRDGDGGLIIYRSGLREDILWYYDVQDNRLRKLKSLRNVDVIVDDPISFLCLHTDSFFSFRNTGSIGNLN